MEHLLERLETLEGELDGMYRELERTQRLSMLGEIAAIIAHEFNNLLTPIRSYAQLALDGDDPDVMRKALEQALVASTRAGRISSSILGLARDEEPGQRTTVDLRRCVEEVFLCLARDPARDGIELRLDIEDLEVQIPGAALHQVLMNLVLNARHAMLQSSSGVRVLAITARTHGGQAMIEVHDTGSGIDPDLMPHIFKTFVSGSEGTGLGLAISRRLVEEWGGRITVESEVGAGTTFTVLLPLAAESDARSAA